jgi:hypothetical protein
MVITALAGGIYGVNIVAMGIWPVGVVAVATAAEIIGGCAAVGGGMLGYVYERVEKKIDGYFDRYQAKQKVKIEGDNGRSQFT